MKTIYILFATFLALALSQTYIPRERTYYIAAVDVHFSKASTLIFLIDRLELCPIRSRPILHRREQRI
jgi:hypothetical protein